MCGIKKKQVNAWTQKMRDVKVIIFFLSVSTKLSIINVHNAKKLIRIRSSIHYSTYLPNRRNIVTKL